MNRLAYILMMISCVALFTCKKDGHAGNTTLTGKWKLSESLLDPGDGSGTWQPVSGNNTVYAQFNSDGRLTGTAFPGYVSYVVKDSVTLTFTSSSNVLQNYRYSINNGTLTMSPDGPIRCYEACGTRYVKIK